MAGLNRNSQLVTTSVIGLLTAQGQYARAQNALEGMSKDPKQWVIPAGNYANTRYSELKQINARNAQSCSRSGASRPACLRGHEGAPLVVGDVMYLHTPFPNIVYALDLNNDGKILWKYEPKQDPNVIPVMCCDTVNRGLAYADGKIFLNQADTTLVALDAKTGKVDWSARSTAIRRRARPPPPAVLPVKDKILVGISGGEFGVRCHDHRL